MKIIINEDYIKNGYISKRKHPKYDYFIYNYTKKTMAEQKWDYNTLTCRGLILDKDNNLIARPFKKFFNLFELKDPIPSYNWFDVYEKLDGSLGILYPTPENTYRIASRGRFDSEVANEANDILLDKYELVNFGEYDEYTFLFEIIYPENRIVVDYKGMRDLVLLGAIHKPTGRYMNYSYLFDIAMQWEMPVVKKYDFKGSLDELYKHVKAMDTPRNNKEGFVLMFNTGFRLKVKFEEYCKIHRVVTELNKKAIWEFLRDGVDIDEVIENTPEEFKGWVLDIADDLFEKFNEIEDRATKVVEKTNDSMTRKEKAEIITKADKDIIKIAFSILDKQSYTSELIWKMIKPKITPGALK